MKLQLRKAFVCLLVLGSALLLMGASTGGEAQAPPSPESFPSKVVWTPDGKHIIFSRGFQGIFMVNVAGSELQAIPEDAPMGTPSSPGYALPALSPHGTQLAFVAQPGGLVQSTAIMVSALDGSGARRMTHDAKLNTHPGWSPDGEEIAYIADGKLSVMRADGSNARVLAPSLEAINAAPGVVAGWEPDCLCGGSARLRATICRLHGAVAWHGSYETRSDGECTVVVAGWQKDRFSDARRWWGSKPLYAWQCW